jgi:indolepyruvate ferredoxin oxidoreductase, beta subunit
MRPWRRMSLRFKKEEKAIADWLALITREAPEDYALALELAECPRIVKGYGDTHAQGEKNYAAIMAAWPTLRGKTDAASRVRKLREAALADDTGEKLARALADQGADRLAPAPVNAPANGPV